MTINDLQLTGLIGDHTRLYLYNYNGIITKCYWFESYVAQYLDKQIIRAKIERFRTDEYRIHLLLED